MDFELVSWERLSGDLARKKRMDYDIERPSECENPKSDEKRAVKQRACGGKSRPRFSESEFHGGLTKPNREAH